MLFALKQNRAATYTQVNRRPWGLSWLCPQSNHSKTISRTLFRAKCDLFVHLVLFDQIDLSDLISGSEHEAGANGLVLFPLTWNSLSPPHLHPSSITIAVHYLQLTTFNHNIINDHLKATVTPDQTIKEHFDTIATALDAATTRAAGYSKTIQKCMK